MQFRTCTRGWRTTLLTAMGFGAAAACGGTVNGIGSTRSNDHPDGAVDDAGSSRSSGGGGGRAGASNSVGGVAVGGAAVGGRGATGGSAGSGGFAGNSGGATAIDAGMGGAFICVDPVPVYKEGLDGGASGGFVRCGNGAVHRPTASECWSDLGLPDAAAPVPGSTDAMPCSSSTGCTDRPYGFCKGFQSIPAGYLTFSCVYGCVQDSDCASGELCRCGTPVGTCVQSTCRTDADCPSGVPCLETIADDFCARYPVRYHCGVECRVDADCQALGLGGMCRGGGCVASQACGRPFLVNGESRAAPMVARTDWMTPLRPDVLALDDADRRTLAQHYTEMALMEHASIAAFARFSLELLALGAPLDLVERAGAALRDETEHARICFGLAEAYGGAAIGPGELELGGAFSVAPIRTLVAVSFLEACIGETCAAVEATEAAYRTTDSTVAVVLRRIAEDEAAHATLGWKFLKWALERIDATERRAVMAELGLALAKEIRDAGCAAATGDRNDVLEGHGLLALDARRALRLGVLTDVVAPCLATVGASRD